MNITFHLIRPHPIHVNLAPVIGFFARLVARLPRLTGVSDDPAALRYTFDKYNGEID